MEPEEMRKELMLVTTASLRKGTQGMQGGALKGTGGEAVGVADRVGFASSAATPTASATQLEDSSNVGVAV